MTDTERRQKEEFDPQDFLIRLSDLLPGDI
jgi:hypothetical protein